MAILFLVLVGLWTAERVYEHALPKIVLPERVHDTIGEIPLVEHYDDGKLERVNPRVRSLGTMLVSGNIAWDTVSLDAIAYIK